MNLFIKNTYLFQRHREDVKPLGFFRKSALYPFKNLFKYKSVDVHIYLYIRVYKSTLMDSSRKSKIFF